MMSPQRLIQVLQKRISARASVPFALKCWDGRSYRFGKGEPVLQIALQDPGGGP